MIVGDDSNESIIDENMKMISVKISEQQHLDKHAGLHVKIATSTVNDIVFQGKPVDKKNNAAKMSCIPTRMQLPSPEKKLFTVHSSMWWIPNCENNR